MKKILGINKFMQAEVPSALDAKILAYAAIRQRQQQTRRRLRILLPAAAALAVLCAGAIAFLHQEETAIHHRQLKPLSNSELLAMNDFTSLEQASYTIDLLNSACEDTEENYI